MSCIIHNNILNINFIYIFYFYIKINNKIIILNNILKFGAVTNPLEGY